MKFCWSGISLKDRLVLPVLMVSFFVIGVACGDNSSADAQAKYENLTDLQAIQIVKEYLAEKEFSYVPPSKPSDCAGDASDECEKESARVVGYCRTIVEGSGIWSVVHLPEYSLWRVRVARSDPF